MTWDYISGFFDADGSISAVKVHSNTNKTIQLSFHNNEIGILEEIKCFIYSELGVVGSITKKKCQKTYHGVAYDLKYTYRNGLLVANKITSCHHKKKHRIEIYNLIQSKTKRNGKYTMEDMKERNRLIDQFFQVWNCDSRQLHQQIRMSNFRHSYFVLYSFGPVNQNVSKLHMI